MALLLTIGIGDGAGEVGSAVAAGSGEASLGDM